MEFHPAPLTTEQIIVQVMLLAALLSGLAGTVYLLTRRPALARIRSSGGIEVAGWWGAALIAWAVTWYAGDRVTALFDRLGSGAGSGFFVVWLLAIFLLPCAALIATGMWIGMRLRRRAP